MGGSYSIVDETDMGRNADVTGRRKSVFKRKNTTITATVREMINNMHLVQI